jgi:hypothetical protein
MKNQEHRVQNNRSRSAMVKCIYLLAIFFSFSAFSPARAQVSVSVNISSQTLWGPVGYDYVEYYYLPEADAFYYVPTGQFIYWSGGQYLFVYSLPAIYHIDFYSTYIVVVNEPKPYLQHEIYVGKYGQYKNSGSNYAHIRDSKDEKYYAVKGHPGHGQKSGSKHEEKSNGGHKSSKHENINGGSNSEKHQKPENHQAPDGNPGGGNKSHGNNSTGAPQQKQALQQNSPKQNAPKGNGKPR